MAVRTVTVDTSKMDRDLRRLVDALGSGAQRVAVDQAETTAAAIDAATPVRTGALASTVRSFPDDKGAAVTYGGGLPYAGYIENRSHPVRKGCRGARTAFYQRLQRLAADETGRV